ncbi:MAG TPA: zf-HC2 domain-containing protein [Vicinamibacterales bacterium]|nr:zf-HC2 domain-containing protein [Vicinamibacterales bacterium]
MKTEACRNQDLGAFVDGELSGAARLRVSQHLASCEACAATADALALLGEDVRSAAAVPAAPPELEGLAGGVISRVRAERAQSWRGFVDRLVDDWHYALVGAGAITAAFVSIGIVSVMLEFGPRPERDDSLAALIANLNSPAGTLFVEATPISGKDRDPILMQVGNDLPDSDGATSGAVPVVLRYASEQELVGALSDAMTPDGRLLELHSMSEQQRRYTEGLLDTIGRLRSGQTAFSSTGSLNVHSLWLVTNTGVTAKGI